MKNSKKIDELQNYGLDILSEFHEICEQNNLEYVLTYGTLLGAIRHQGFIPWDDDIDVGMTRKDYEKFSVIAKNQLPSHMFLQTHSTDKNYFLPYPKIRIPDKRYIEKSVAHLDMVHGPWIDIFIYDNQYDDIDKERKKQKEFNKQINFYNIITPVMYQQSQPNQFKLKTLAKKIVIKVLKLSQKPKRNLIMRYLDYKYKKIESVLEEYPEENISGNMMTYSLPENENNRPEGNVLNVEDFDNRVLTKFEEYKFYIPENYEEILTNSYGDYNKLPPLEERTSPHLWMNHPEDKTSLKN